ncbi:endoribonuclease Arlr [Calliopsis andreniformis]|uniref:endoribonuclease Arlr n=1 Tax=Calliopsis andreniformis TaxID=337506 RepID=UPI003FCEAA31
MSEELFSKSSHELYKHLCIRYQGQTTLNNMTDNAPERLLKFSLNSILTMTTRSMIKLFDNYEFDTSQTEIKTEEEDIEENDFINNLMKTDVMLHAMTFLSAKRFFRNDIKIYKNILKEIWFHLYSRDKGINSSSGFEHVFLGERKSNKQITGLHNWISFSFGEQSNKINYFGFSKKKEITTKAVILNTLFTYFGGRKLSTIFIGTVPELEIALYTLCFYTRPNKKCPVSFEGFKFAIQTYTLNSNNKKFVATAYPII